jgi:5-aminopentanamidase
VGVTDEEAGMIVAVAQLEIAVGEVDGNRAAAARAVAEAAGLGAGLVVLPELCDSGYVFSSPAEARELAGMADNSKTLDQWRALCDAYGLVIAGGFCELGGDGLLYNSAAIVDASGVRAVYRKSHLWDAEKTVFTPGDGAPPVVDLPFGRVGLMICYDLEFPEWVRLVAMDGADLIAAPVNWPATSAGSALGNEAALGPKPEDGQPPEVIKARADAAVNGVFVAVADRCGAERGVDWISGSLIASPSGATLAGPVLADRPAVLAAECDLTLARDKRVSARNDLIADRRPELYQRGRVAIAVAHWLPRIIANGTDYADAEAALRDIRDWDDWPAAWERIGVRYVELAREAADAGHVFTAGDAWRRAALCYHWARFVHVREPLAAAPNVATYFERGAAALTPPAERVHIPDDAEALVAYLRVPAQAAPPVVIMIPGLDSVKEELQATADYLLRRGLAVLAVDGPGQGEATGSLPIEPAYERVVRAAVDFLRARRPDVDTERIGVFGVSLGGYYAARACAYVPEVRAGVTLTGPYRLDLDWATLPPQTRQVFQQRSGAADAAGARERAAALTLQDAAPRITCPLLVVHGGADRLIPVSHAERLAREAPGAELLVYPEGNHGVTNRAFESRSRIADWLAARLGA